MTTAAAAVRVSASGSFASGLTCLSVSAGSATPAFTSVRISRINIIAAIRDLPAERGRELRRRWVVLSAVVGLGLAVLAGMAIADSAAVGTYLFPPLAALSFCPLLLRVLPARPVYNGVSLAVLAWSLLANTVRPRILDESSTAGYVILGVALVFSAVFLVCQNQEFVTRPFRRLLQRPTPNGLATRLAVAYPLARRFRTGAILIIYSLVVFTLVLITVLGSMVSATVDGEVANASGGFPIRTDFNPSFPIPDPARSLTTGPFAGNVAAAVPLLVARGRVSIGTIDEQDVVVVGAGSGIAREGLYPLTMRMPAFRSDLAAWRAVLADPRYVVVDQFMGQAGGGPPTVTFAPGDALVLVDPGTGKGERKIIAGILRSAIGFYGMANTGYLSPVIMSDEAARSEFGDRARLAGALIKPAPGVAEDWLSVQLQGQFLGHGMVAMRVRRSVERVMAANRGFFQLMQGFLALGLLVGIAGLGVVMVRAVRERRRTIGVLRAIGFPARTVLRAFLIESGFVVTEGLLVGAGLAIVTSYLLFTNYVSFSGLGIGFPVPWGVIGVLLAVSALASILATLGPARAASRIRPAVALRIAD